MLKFIDICYWFRLSVYYFCDCLFTLKFCQRKTFVHPFRTVYLHNSRRQQKFIFRMKVTTFAVYYVLWGGSRANALVYTIWCAHKKVVHMRRIYRHRHSIRVVFAVALYVRARDHNNIIFYSTSVRSLKAAFCLVSCKFITETEAPCTHSHKTHT